MSITNTSALDHGWPYVPSEIERQEREGAAEILASDLLPVRIVNGFDSELEDLGLVLGGRVEGDPLFRHVVLPDGWSRKRTAHDMWTNVVDETGVVRIRVFYKAACYDRRSHLMIERAAG